MTAPYRIRDARGDRKALLGLLGTFGSAVALGLTPEFVEDPSAAPVFFVTLLVVWTGLLLLNMHGTDRRLREVSAS